MNHIKLLEIEVAPVTTYQVEILSTLETTGRMRAYVFDEQEVDELFKMRPRLIRLVPGYVDPIIDITVEGRKRLQLERQ
jgi:hypothetical protein